MNWPEILYSIGALASAIAAILAWIAKIRWSNEYRESKEAQIASVERELEGIKNTKEEHIRILQGQIDYWKSLTPDKVREYFIANQTSLEKNIDTLSIDVERLNRAQTASTVEINGLRKSGTESEKKIIALLQENEAIKVKHQEALNELNRLRQTSLTPKELEKVSNFVTGTAQIFLEGTQSFPKFTTPYGISGAVKEAKDPEDED